jgi:hypothetical protein
MAETRQVKRHTAFSTNDGHSAIGALFEWTTERADMPRIVDDGSIGNLESIAVVCTSRRITVYKRGMRGKNR